jgi:acetyl/propionyl-CoA carboxylase alpha subunit
MPALVRKIGVDVSVFDLGMTHLITALEKATLTFEVNDKDASGIHDAFEYAWATKQKWSLDCDAFAEATAALMPLAGNSVAVNLDSGANVYTGQALIVMAKHDMARDELQTQNVSLHGQGGTTIS